MGRFGGPLLTLSMRLFALNRPRASWLAFELQMLVHGLIGNGWDGVLMQLRRS